MTERSVEARRAAARSGAGPADDVPAKAQGRTQPAPAGGAWLPWTVAGLGIVWLVAKLWSAYEQIHANAGDSVAVATAALAIPAVVQATALGGLGGGLAVRMTTEAWRVRRTGAPPITWLRCLATAAGGLVIGLAAMGAILGAYGDVPSIEQGRGRGRAHRSRRGVLTPGSATVRPWSPPHWPRHSDRSSWTPCSTPAAPSSAT